MLFLAASANYLLEIQHASSNAADIPTCEFHTAVLLPCQAKLAHRFFPSSGVVEPETPEQVGNIVSLQLNTVSAVLYLMTFILCYKRSSKS